METEADGQSVAEVTPVDAAPDLPVEAGSDKEPMSFADAFAEAKAEVAAPENPDGATAPNTGEAVVQPEGEAAASQPANAATEPVEQPVTPEPAQETPEQIAARARQELLNEQAQAKYWREQYVENLTEQAVDPEAFNQKLIDTPGLAEFMREYRARNPEVTLEDPDPGPKQPSAEEIGAEIRKSYNDGLHAILTDAASRTGVDFASLPGVAEGKLGTVIDSLIQKGVEAGVKAALPKALEKEREAIRTELQSEFMATHVVTPRAVGGAPVTGQAVKTGPISWREAAAEAKAELEIAS